MFDNVMPDKDIMAMAVLDRMQSIEKKEPSVTLAMDEYNFYLGHVLHKSIKGLSDEEFNKIKNKFVLTLEEELCSYHKFVNEIKLKRD